MSSTKPSVPKGTRDFTPQEMVRRNYIFSVIRNSFERYGFLPVETPAMENLSTLLGKYGQEGDKLLFRILNSGNFLSKANEESLKEKDSQSLSMEICDRGLRYDLTVPFARFVVQHRHEINFPFRRYQIQPVWRADRPQKGRYREFYQCDADVVGSNSLISEAEFIFIMDEVFSEFKIPSTIKINNRKILTGLAEVVGLEDRFSELTVLIDKIDKMGLERITREFEILGLAENGIRQLTDILGFHGSTSEKLQYLKEVLKNSDIGRKGIEELEQTIDYVSANTLNNHLEVDNSLARGLEYYTGAIFEVKANNMQMGSICGGGRYDDLTGIFGMPGISGVGISFGAERIYDVLLQEGLFPEHTGKTVDLMFVNFGKKEVKYILPLLAKIRRAGINAELYPDDVKMKKQMNYANNHKIPFVALIGEAEMADEVITLKDMNTGEQKPYTFDAMKRTISSSKAS